MSKQNIDKITNMAYNDSTNQKTDKGEEKMIFMFSKVIMGKAEEQAAEMIKTGEKIRQMKLGQNGNIYLSSDESLVNCVKSFEISNVMFFIGSKK